MTNVDLDDGASYPTTAAIGAFSTLADANNLWEAPYVGPQNLVGTSPWAKIANITEDARWIWGNPKDVANPLIGGANHSEYQIFRLCVPTPGTIELGVMGTALLIRRRGR